MKRNSTVRIEWTSKRRSEMSKMLEAVMFCGVVVLGGSLATGVEVAGRVDTRRDAMARVVCGVETVGTPDGSGT